MIGTHLIDCLLRDTAHRKLRLASGEVRRRARQRRVRIGEIGLGLLDFGRLHGSLEIGQLFLRLGELLPGLVARGAVGDIVLGEQRRVLRNDIATGHVDCSEQAGLGRPNLDVVGLGIALPRDRRNAPRRPPPEAATTGRDKQHDRQPYASVHGFVSFWTNIGHLISPDEPDPDPGDQTWRPACNLP